MTKFISALFLICLAPLSWGTNPHIRFASPDYANLQESVMVLNSYGIPLNRIKKDKKELTVAPAYIKASSKFDDKQLGNRGDNIDSIQLASTANSIRYEESDSKGVGVVFNWFQGMSDKWGYSVTGSYVRLSGDTAAFAEYDAAGNKTVLNMAEEKGHASQLMAYFVYDPLYKKEKYSLLLFGGVGLYHSSQEATLNKMVNVTNLSNVEVAYKSEIDYFNVGFTTGFAFSVRTGDFNWTTFLMAYISPSAPEYDVSANRTDTGENLLADFSTKPETDTIFPSGGFKVSYMPWEVSLSYIPNIFNLVGGDDEDFGVTSETSQSIITVSKTFTF